MEQEIEDCKIRLMPRARAIVNNSIGKKMTVRLDKHTLFEGTIKHAGIGWHKVSSRRVQVVFAVDLEGANGAIKRVHVSGLPR